MKTLEYGVLVSGDLGWRSLMALAPQLQIKFVMTDKNSEKVIEFCSVEKKIPCFAGNPRNGKAFEFIKQYPVDVLLSINYLFVLNRDIIDFPRKYALNFHGSLLPKYRGRTPHVWAIINNEQESGITAHFISEDCDCGDIVLQEKIPIGTEDTGNDLLLKLIGLYPAFIMKVVTMIEVGKLLPQRQDHSKATFYGKRTPLDGRIEWTWQKERIRNWVRAQAYPYPGAFTFYSEKKIFIHKIAYSDAGFHYEDINGKVLETEPYITVKTPNGAIQILEYKTEDQLPLQIRKGEILI